MKGNKYIDLENHKNIHHYVISQSAQLCVLSLVSLLDSSAQSSRPPPLIYYNNYYNILDIFVIFNTKLKK